MMIVKNILYIVFGFVWIYVTELNVLEENLTKVLRKSQNAEFVLNILWVIAAFFLFLGIFSLVEKAIFKFLTKISSRTESAFDDHVTEVAYNSLYSLKYFGASYVAWLGLNASDKVLRIGDKFFSIAIIVIFLLFTTRFLRVLFSEKIMKHSKGKKLSKALLSFIQKAIIIMMWLFGIITILSNLGYNVSALIAGAGVGWIAIALAAQKSVANIFGAITILLNRPFEIGDYITINAHTGTVKDIGLTYITLIDRMGHEVKIPNENTISTSIENESKRKFRRADFSIGLIYDTTLTQMKKWVSIIEQILESYVEKDILQSYRVNFEAFGDFSLNINVTYFTNTKAYNEFVKEKEEINLEIKKSFAKAKLEMAFPTQEMIIKSGELK